MHKVSISNVSEASLLFIYKSTMLKPNLGFSPESIMAQGTKWDCFRSNKNSNIDFSHAGT